MPRRWPPSTTTSAPQWGEAVEGVQVSAHPTKRQWPLGSAPTLRVRIRDTGEKRWTFHKRPYSFGLLIDGRRCRDQHAYHTWDLPFGRGDEYELTLTLNKLWSEGELGAAWTPFLRPLGPGEHTVTVVLTELGRFVRPKSLSVEIEVTGPVADAAEDQADARKADDADQLIGQWQSVEGNQPLKLAPGKPTLRYGWPGYHASNSDPSQIDKEHPLLLWSGPVEIVAERSASDEGTEETDRQCDELSVQFSGTWVWWEKARLTIQGDGAVEFSMSKAPNSRNGMRN